MTEVLRSSITQTVDKGDTSSVTVSSKTSIRGTYRPTVIVKLYSIRDSFSKVFIRTTISTTSAERIINSKEHVPQYTKTYTCSLSRILYAPVHTKVEQSLQELILKYEVPHPLLTNKMVKS